METLEEVAQELARKLVDQRSPEAQVLIRIPDGADDRPYVVTLSVDLAPGRSASIPARMLLPLDELLAALQATPHTDCERCAEIDALALDTPALQLEVDAARRERRDLALQAARMRGDG